MIAARMVAYVTLTACALHLSAQSAIVAPSEPVTQQVHSQVEAGARLFESTCASGMCHGSGGAGAHGPSLKRPLAPDLIRETLQNGRPGTPMPAFRDVFDSSQQAQLIAFVTSLGSNGKQPTSVVVIQGSPNSAPTAKQTPSAPWLVGGTRSAAAAVAGGSGNPRAGVVLFFDATKLYSCHSCHTYGGAGGPLGPDLVKLEKSADEIYGSISRANIASPYYPAVILTLSDGSHLTGIKRDETEEALRIYDVSSVPPVSRRLRKSQLREITPITTAGIYDHTGLPYSKQDLLDLSAFLGKNSAP
jgi:mono/diheme cytochrome c family protein